MTSGLNKKREKKINKEQKKRNVNTNFFDMYTNIHTTTTTTKTLLNLKLIDGLE